MRPWTIGSAVALALSIGAGGALLPAHGGAEPQWLADYEEGRAEARRSGKLLLVGFR